jgi:formate dehydrogenase iron-sulfur subunit
MDGTKECIKMSNEITRRDFLKIAGVPMIMAPMVFEGVKKGIQAPVQELGTQKAVLVDSRRCIGCRGCQIACKAHNNLPGEKTEISNGEYTNPSKFSAITWKVVHFKEIGDYDGNQSGTGGLKWRMLADNCKHCDDPDCITVCPTGALWKRSDGPVLYDVTRCIGCSYCEMACPQHIPNFDETIGSIRKCTMCYDLIDKGLEPACVATCPTDALQYMTKEEAIRLAKEAEAEGLYTYGTHERGGGNFIFISDIPFEEFGLPDDEQRATKQFEADMLTRFAGIGLLGGALYAAANFYVERKKAIESVKLEEDE